MSESKLKAFLRPAVAENEEVIISTRFTDDKGEVVPFVIRALTQEENDKLTKKCTVTTKDRTGQQTRHLDQQRYSREVIVAATVVPDFSSKEICDAYEVVDPTLIPGKMLLAGEYLKLADAIAKLSGLGDEEEEVKN